MYTMNHGWAMGLGWLVDLIALAAIIWLIIIVVNQRNKLAQLNISPLNVLKKRYAKGKIGRKKFEKKRRLLL